jgi:peptidoglycan/xylan/chitin deacetylase (PgdA/CDA1 family)
LPQEQVILELDVSRAEIEAHLDVQPVSFASPFGEYSDATLELIMQRYTYHALAYGGTEGRNPNPAVDPREIGRMNVDKDVAPEAVCNEARRASQNGTWLVLTFHTFQAVDPEKYQTSPEALRQILGCATELRDSGELRIVTLRQAMELMGGG